MSNLLIKYIFDLWQNVKNKGFFHLLTANYLTQLVSFVSVLIVAKILSPTELGEVKILQSYTTIFIIVAGFGFNTVVLKFCSEKRSQNNRLVILRYALGRSQITTLLTLLGILVLSLTGVVTSSKELSTWLIIYSLTLPPIVFTTILLTFLQALKKIPDLANSQAIIRLVSVGSIIIGTWLWGFEGFILASIIGSFISLFPAIRRVGLGFLAVASEDVPRKFTQLAMFSALANGVSQLGQQGDIILLDHFSSDREAIGYYSLGIIFFVAASQVTATVQSIATPYFSESSKDATRYRRLLIVNQARMALLSIVVALGIYLVARMLIPIVYGPDYLITLNFLPLFLLKYVIWSSYALIGAALVGMGLMHYTFTVAAISTPIGLVLSFIMLQQFELMGLAWAQVINSLLIFTLILIAIKIALKREFRHDRESTGH